MADKPQAALPAVPPVPHGEQVESKARALATLIASMEGAVIHHRSDRLTAMVIVVEGRVIDAIAETQDGVVKGVEVLDELADVPMTELKVTRVHGRLARVLPAYWRAPGAAREVVQGFLRPGRRGAIAVTAPSGTGVLLFDEEGVVASYRDGEHSPGTDALEELLDDPQAVISARADSMPVAPPRHAPGDPTGGQQRQPGQAPLPPQPPAPPEAFGGSPTTQPAPRPLAAPQHDGQFDARRQVIIQMVRNRLQRLAGPVEEQFQAAGNMEQLQAAAERVRTMQIRMVNPLTLQSIAQDALAIARGELPTA